MVFIRSFAGVAVELTILACTIAIALSMGAGIRPWQCHSERCNHIGCSRARVTMSDKNLRFTSLGLETENNMSNQCDVKRN